MQYFAGKDFPLESQCFSIKMALLIETDFMRIEIIPFFSYSLIYLWLNKFFYCVISVDIIIIEWKMIPEITKIIADILFICVKSLLYDFKI